jgi:hypothetical protein
VSQVSVNTVADSLILAPADSTRPSTACSMRPETPMDGRYGSLRSILRDRNTPATGQSVRFFSRDAFRVMTPEGSAASEQDDSSLPENLNFNDANPQAELSPSGSRIRHRIRAPVQNLFLPSQGTSSPSTSPISLICHNGTYHLFLSMPRRLC